MNVTPARLKQARESLEEAKDLLVQDAGVNFVMNSLFYAFLYCLLGLLEAQGSAVKGQREAISQFEEVFVSTGKMDRKFLDALRTAYDLKPACDCEGKKSATAEDVEALLPLADEFLETAEKQA